MIKSKYNVKQFWDLIFSIGAISGMWYWYTIIDDPLSIFPLDLFIMLIFVTLFIIPLGCIAIVFSIIRHKNQIKLFFVKPQQAVEFSLELKEQKAGWLLAFYIFGLNLVIFFFLLTIPIEESLTSIPFVGENLNLVLNQLIKQFENLFFDMINEYGYNLDFGNDFGEKMIVLSILFTISPIYFLVLRLLRIHVKNENIEKKSERYPGSRGLIVFLYIVLALTLQKILFDLDGLMSIGSSWILITVIFGAFPMIAILFVHEAVSKKLL